LKEDGSIFSPDMEIFRKQYRASSSQAREMMTPRLFAPVWCLEVEFESQVDQNSKGYDKIQRLFEKYGVYVSHSQIQEIWLLVYPQRDEGDLTVPRVEEPFDLVTVSHDRPASGSKYIAIFLRGYYYSINQLDPPYLFGYFILEPNKRNQWDIVLNFNN
jgi:hypothetical protein